MKLVNLSNHNSKNWSNAQKEGFDEIVDIQFPNINPNADENNVELLVNEYIEKIQATKIENIMLQGEFTFCFLLQNKLRTRCKFYIPTTERKVVETIDVNGNATKTAIFEFVRWRTI